MNKYIYLIFTFLLINFTSLAQDHYDCGTTIQEQSTTYTFVQKQRAQPIIPTRNATDDVPVKFHFIGTNNGLLAADSADIFDELEIVNNHYAGANIRFVHCGRINYIFDNNYITFKKGTDEGLCEMHDKPNVINIYFAPNLERDDGTSLCGYAYNFGIRPRVLMDNGCSTNTSTLAHEFGHSFSLLHTHSSFNGSELADGSNCSNAGDLLCDTPADPRLDSDLVNSSCEYVGVETDSQGDAYMPDPENIMSYSRKACRIHFSEEQLLQVEAYYLVNGVGFFECTPDNPTTSTEELFDTYAIEVFPNPSQSTIFIKNIPNDADIELIDLTGKVLWETTIQATSPQYELTEFQKLSKGVYYLKVLIDGTSTTKKLIRL